MTLKAGIKGFIITLFLLISTGFNAQITEGRIVFERKTNLKKRMGDNPRMKNFITEENKYRIENFELFFNDTSCVFKPIPDEEVVDGFIKYFTTHNTVYQNLIKKEKFIVMDLWGNNAYIKDSMDTRTWKITTNSRVISGFNCKKAIWEMNKRELMDVVETQNRMIKDLKLKLANKQETGRRSLKLVRMDHDWDAAETLFADVVSEHVKEFLFPRYKFLKPGWDEYQPDTEDSLSSLVERCLSDRQPKSDKKEMWERVTAVSIKLKYGTLKCNINNAIKAAYKSELSVVAIVLCDNKNE